MTVYEDRLTIATPEGVDLDLPLGGLASRFLAGVVDQLLKFVLIGLLAVAVLAIGGLGLAVLIPAAALVMFGYDVLWEVLGHGRTPGKRWIGLRVVRGDGSPVDVRASLVRNVLRLIDGWPLSYLPTIVLVVVTKRNQRLGDLAADTVVVREPRAPAPQPGRATQTRDTAPRRDAPGWDVSAVGDEHVAALRAFLERRDALDPDTRRRIAGQLARPLRGRVGGATEDDPERFLEGVAAAKDARERPF